MVIVMIIIITIIIIIIIRHATKCPWNELTVYSGTERHIPEDWMELFLLVHIVDACKINSDSGKGMMCFLYFLCLQPKLMVNGSMPVFFQPYQILRIPKDHYPRKISIYKQMYTYTYMYIYIYIFVYYTYTQLYTREKKQSNKMRLLLQ